MAEARLRRELLISPWGGFPDIKVASLQKEDLFKRGFLCLVAANHPRRTMRRKNKNKSLMHEPHLVCLPGRAEEAFERFRKAPDLSGRS